MRDLSDTICHYINKEWIAPWDKSARAFANEHDLDEKTVRKIKLSNKNHYSISLSTLEKICTAKGITLEEFFRLIKR